MKIGKPYPFGDAARAGEVRKSKRYVDGVDEWNDGED
jgi:hypothetical protein